MITSIYKKVLAAFVAYLLILNMLTFFTSLSPKALVNPFFIKNRTISMTHLAKHIVLVAGLGLVTASEEEINALVNNASEKYDTDPKLIHIMIEVESKGRQFAISRTGAMGLMQVMPSTFYYISSGDPFLAEDNIEAGVKYFSRQLKKFGSVELALAAYNAGPQRVKDGKVPDFGETKHYIKRILSVYNQ
ncbi:MAG: lytic transglycosylase domain-containing protein [Denitrovibrio sp.]|nr:MAG: lytic transglycosylase domain-containing protein [Denitrovibrio sp.]